MKKIFHIILFLGFANVLLGQVGLRVDPTQFDQECQLDWENRPDSTNVFFKKNNSSQIPLDLKKYFLANKVGTNNSNIFAKKNANQELAFFCRIEEKIELKSNIPVRFRLGEVQAVDRKEGKWKQFN